MITLFSIPKGFSGPTGIIQENAIKSWALLEMGCKIILFGNEPGVSEIAKKYNCIHVDDIHRNEFDTPLVSDAFIKAQAICTTKAMCYVNSDIILSNKLLDAFQLIENKIDNYCIIGRRIDFDVHTRLHQNDFASLFINANRNGKLHGFSGIDYIIFPHGILTDLPKLAVGRIGWDNWMLYHFEKSGQKLLDITPYYSPIHQNHDYKHLKGGRNKGKESSYNLISTGSRKKLFTLYSIRDAKYCLNQRGNVVKRFDMYFIYRWLSIICYQNRYTNKMLLLARKLLFR